MTMLSLFFTLEQQNRVSGKDTNTLCLSLCQTSCLRVWMSYQWCVTVLLIVFHHCGEVFFFFLYIYSTANARSNTRNTIVQKNYKVKLMSLWTA